MRKFKTKWIIYKKILNRITEEIWVDAISFFFYQNDVDVIMNPIKLLKKKNLEQSNKGHVGWCDKFFIKIMLMW